MPENSQPDSTAQREVIDQLHKILDELKRPKPRDFWDKVSILGTFLSTVIIAALAIAVKVSTDRTNNAIQQQNSNIQQAAIAEKFLPHLAGNDPSKHSAEMMIVWLGYPDVVRQFALSDGDLEILKNISDSPSARSFDTAMTEAYKKAEKQLVGEWNADRHCLAGDWHDHTGNSATSYRWKFEMLEPRHLTITKLNDKGPGGTSDLRKVGERWAGELKLAEDDWPTFEIIPDVAHAAGADGCHHRLLTNRAFNYTKD